MRLDRFLIVLFSLFLCETALSDYRGIQSFGTGDALCIEGVKSRSDFQTWVVKNQDKLYSVLRSANWAGDPADLVKQIQKGEFKEKKYPPGTRLHWLGAMKNGKATALPKRRWDGDTPFIGYELALTTETHHYTFVIPKICCNFALLSESWRGVRIPIPKSPVHKPVLAKKATIEPYVRFIAGREKSRFAARTVVSSGGDCKDCGDCKKCDPNVKPPPEVKPEIDGSKPDNTEIDANGQISGTNQNYQAVSSQIRSETSDVFGLRLGLIVPIKKGLGFYPGVGILDRSGGNEESSYPTTSVGIDFEMRKSVSHSWFVGAGIGAWNINDDSYKTSSAFLSTGSNLSKDFSWFVETRHFASDDTGAADNAFFAGFQLKFSATEQ